MALRWKLNANKYSWVWKNACLTSRLRLYTKITTLLEKINSEILCYECYRYDFREEYSIDYLESIINDFKKRFKIDKYPKMGIFII